ncbi:MAG: hypothetical protein H7832_02940 [Magnetococcus sp. DMHC-6]
MKKSYVTFAASLIVLGFAGSAAAESPCVLSYVRTACAGQEAVSYAKCGGKAACDKEKDADMKPICVAEAEKACSNDRVDITKSKIIKAKFRGEQLVGGYNDAGAPDPKGFNFCAADRPDFNKCK